MVISLNEYLCSECGSPLVLSHNGEYVCEKCGLIHHREIKESLIRRVNDDECKSNTQYHYVEVLNRSPFKTPIFYTKLKGDMHGDSYIKALRHYGKLDFIQRYYVEGLPIKSVRKAYAVLLSLCSLIPQQSISWIKRRALEMYYLVIIKNKSVKKNHVALITASFYVALRERCRNIDITLKSLIEHLKKMGFNITLSDVFRGLFMLRRSLGVVLKPRKADDLLPLAINKILSNDEVKRKASKNNIDLWLYSKRLCEEARRLLHKEELQCSKNPMSLIAVALYTADRILTIKYQWKELLTQRILSSILKVSPFTIRELYYKFFRKHIFGDLNERKGIENNS